VNCGSSLETERTTGVRLSRGSAAGLARRSRRRSWAGRSSMLISTERNSPPRPELAKSLRPLVTVLTGQDQMEGQERSGLRREWKPPPGGARGYELAAWPGSDLLKAGAGRPGEKGRLGQHVWASCVDSRIGSARLGIEGHPLGANHSHGRTRLITSGRPARPDVPGQQSLPTRDTTIPLDGRRWQQKRRTRLRSRSWRNRRDHLGESAGTDFCLDNIGDLAGPGSVPPI